MLIPLTIRQALESVLDSYAEPAEISIPLDAILVLLLLDVAAHLIALAMKLGLPHQPIIGYSEIEKITTDIKTVYTL